MIRAPQNMLRALRRARTAEVEVGYHCRRCKVYDSRTLAPKAVAGIVCRCGSTDLLLLSVSPEPSSPLRVQRSLRPEPGLGAPP